MSNDTSLQASFWLMAILQTIGSVDMPGSGPRKLPAPREYTAIIVMWSVLSLVADVGWRRPAVTMAWVTVLAGMVLGPFGTKFINLLNTITSKFAVTPPAQTPNFGGTSG